MVLAVVHKWEKGKLYRLGEKVNQLVLVVLGVVVWVFAQILNTPVIVVYRFGIYGISFFLGYFVFAHEPLVDF